MSEGRKINSRVAGCLIKLVCFVLMVIAFMALIFFLFSGLSYFLSGEEIELPQFGKMWSFLSEQTEGIFQKVDDGLNELGEPIGGATSSDGESATESATESQEDASVNWGDWTPDTVTVQGDRLVFSKMQA